MNTNACSTEVRRNKNVSHALGDTSVKILLCGISEIFLSVFSSRTLMVSRLIFKSFIHLEFIFVCGVSW